MNELTWTTGKPKKSGFYFYRQSSDEDPILLKVEIEADRVGSHRLVWLHGDNAPESLEQCHGEFAGPIEPPA